MRDAPSAGRMPTRAEQLGIPGRRTRGTRVERIEQRRRARDPPAHPRAAEILPPAEPDQPAGHARALRRDREPPGCGEIECRGIAPQLADDGGETRASYALLHRPKCRPRVTRFDM